MKKLYLGVAINDYKQAPLNGCVNDVEDLSDLLISRYGFKPGDHMRMLTDRRATKTEIILRLQWLVANTGEDDLVVFQYSGHGSQVASRTDTGEIDGMDEVLVPYDYYMDWDNNLLTDNELGSYAKQIRERGGVAIFIIDACHSGTATRGLSVFGKSQDIEDRYMEPPLDIAFRARAGVQATRTLVNTEVDTGVLISGCQDHQTSADAYIDGRYNGAMTRALIEILGHNPKTKYEQLCTLLPDRVKGGGFTQIPGVTGPEQLLGLEAFA